MHFALEAEVVAGAIELAQRDFIRDLCAAARNDAHSDDSGKHPQQQRERSGDDGNDELSFDSGTTCAAFATVIAAATVLGGNSSSSPVAPITFACFAVCVVVAAGAGATGRLGRSATRQAGNARPMTGSASTLQSASVMPRCLEAAERRGTARMRTRAIARISVALRTTSRAGQARPSD